MANGTVGTDTKKPQTAATVESIKRAYKLGLTDGRRRAEKRIQRSIECLTKTNSALLDLVRVLDMDFPLQAVVLPLPLAEHVLSLLRKHCPKAREVPELEHAVEVCRQEWTPPADEIEEQLREVVG
jgi:hypothetical protein